MPEGPYVDGRVVGPGRFCRWRLPGGTSPWAVPDPLLSSTRLGGFSPIFPPVREVPRLSEFRSVQRSAEHPLEPPGCGPRRSGLLDSFLGRAVHRARTNTPVTSHSTGLRTVPTARRMQRLAPVGLPGPRRPDDADSEAHDPADHSWSGAMSSCSERPRLRPPTPPPSTATSAASSRPMRWWRSQDHPPPWVRDLTGPLHSSSA